MMDASPTKKKNSLPFSKGEEGKPQNRKKNLRDQKRHRNYLGDRRWLTRGTPVFRSVCFAADQL
jgi:hypothetical protein